MGQWPERERWQLQLGPFCRGRIGYLSAPRLRPSASSCPVSRNSVTPLEPEQTWSHSAPNNMTDPPPPDPTAQLSITLRLAAHPQRIGHTDHQVELGPDATIAVVKDLVTKWDGQPRADGVVVIMGGRILQDDEQLAKVVPEGVSRS